MIHVTSMSEAQLNEASSVIAEAFLAQDGIFPALGLTKERIAKYMKALLRLSVKCGELYMVSENGEGYIAYADSRYEKSPFIASARMLWESLDALGWDGFMKYTTLLSQAGSSQEQTFRSRFQPFINVSMLVIPEAYQHQGYMRMMLEEVFAKADEEGLPVLLETDSEHKMERYRHLGMEIASQHAIGHGMNYYNMIRYPKRRV
jgi:GNAT superfamily N-acetyltransferase